MANDISNLGLLASRHARSSSVESALPAPIADAPPNEADIEAFKASVLAKLTLAIGKDGGAATPRDWFVATALALRDRVIHRWLAVNRATHAEGRKRVYYLSLEFLIGRLFADVVENLRMTETVKAALGDLGVDLDRMRRAEPDAALGNGGLGRLAACLMESMASLGIPARGYGIRYDHGLFRQVIRDGWQMEFAENWLSFGNPWEFARPEFTYDIHYGGRVETVVKGRRRQQVWVPDETIEAVAYDTPVVGWRAGHVNSLRLWSARAIDPLRLEVFNEGDHVGALAQQARAEALSKILYPADNTPAGRELRLRQEYFFVSASLQDILRRQMQYYGDLPSLPDRAAIQLNDTHPSIAIAELMRLLMDVHNLPWEVAWRVTVGTFSYTNHTLLPEALETWPVALFERVLPRHLDIIYRINSQHLEHAATVDGVDDGGHAAVSIIDERYGRHVRMGHLAFVGSHKVNGVSELHTKLMRETVFADLHRLYPDRIVNKTNGITFRRWLHQANPRLTRFLAETCGKEVLDDVSALPRLAEYADDHGAVWRLAAVKRANKRALARFVHEQMGLTIDPSALFDVHIKRIHEYKRQLLNLLDTVARYHAIRANPQGDWVPRVKIFAGKAAASYAEAKLIIKLANDIAAVVNSDPATRDLLRLVFLPNYNVSLAEMIIPAADLSEQISTAGMEASGTGNMKLALNGALTIGTLDGANIEIREQVGEENIFIFGLGAEEVAARRRSGLDARDAIGASPELAAVLDAVGSGVFSPDDPYRFRSVADRVRYVDPYMIAADFAAYRAAQAEVDALWQRPEAWGRACALNIAHMGWFSADRTISEYAADVWNIPLQQR
ncbi:MAG: glycogen/starch/alpha-glucan phosphorylase [Alphaproteobacteria bacterium]|nr:glycogen/starch/alpha-glucan phosphorylase [Alphaproteobacteria bacterium]